MRRSMWSAAGGLAAAAYFCGERLFPAGFFCRAAAGSWGGVSGDGPAAAFGPGEAAEVEGPWIKISR